MDYEKTVLKKAWNPSRLILHPLGMWPDKDRKSWRSRIIFTLSAVMMFYLSTVSQTVMLVKVWGDLNAFIEVLTTIDLPLTNALIKACCFRYNIDVLQKLMSSILQDWKSPKTAKEWEIMKHNAKLGRLISIVVLGIPMVSLSMYTATLLLFMHENKKLSLESNSTDVVRVLYYRAEYFYDVQRTPIYQIIWATQFISAIIAAMSFAAIDAFFSIVVLHLSGQLDILKKHFNDVIKKEADNKKSFRELFSSIVARHDYLFQFADSIEASFNLTFLAQMLALTLVLCLNGFQFVKLITAKQISVVEIIFIIYFTLCFAGNLFLLNYLAEDLRAKSLEIGEAVYQSQWHDLASADRKLLIMVIHRSRKPFNLTAGKFAVLSLELCSKIVKTAGGYLSVLLAVRDRLAD